MRFLLVLLLAALGACATRGAAVHEIPFRYTQHQILIETRVNGQGPFTFILDTGVTPSGVDLETAGELGLPRGDGGEAEGMGIATVTAYDTRLTNVEIAGVAYGDFDAAAFGMHGLSRRIGEPLHGILGTSFLHGKRVTIDYARQVVTIGGPPVVAGPDAYQFPLVTAPDDIMPIMQMSVNGRQIAVSMDTGASSGLDLFESSLAQLGLEAEVANWEAASGEGARGRFDRRRGALPEVTIGPFTLHDAPASVTAREGERYRQANAGNALFETFVATFDYIDNTVTLRRRAER